MTEPRLLHAEAQEGLLWLYQQLPVTSLLAAGWGGGGGVVETDCHQSQ